MPMTERKVIKAKLGLLELAGQLGSLSQAGRHRAGREEWGVPGVVAWLGTPTRTRKLMG
jgi:hypothetical protein